MAEQDQDRRQDNDRTDDRQADHGDAGVGEGLQEGELEHEQGDEAGGDGQAGEHDRAPGGADGPGDRRRGVVAGGELLPVAVDHQQRVVDGQPEAEGGGEVEGEDRDVGQAGDELQRQERADDGEATDGQWEHRRDNGPEDDDQQDQRQRQGDDLGEDQVGLDSFVDLAEHRGHPTDGDLGHPVEVALVQLLPQLPGTIQPFALVTGEAEEDQRPVAVGGPQRRGRTQRPVARGLHDLATARQVLGEGHAGRSHFGRIDRTGGGGNEQHHIGGAAVEGVGDDSGGRRGLRPRVVEAAGDQGVLDVTTQRAGDDEPDEGEDGDQPRAADGQRAACGGGGRHGWSLSMRSDGVNSKITTST